MTRTEDLFTFELDMGDESFRLMGQQLEDTVFNCLDFSVLYHRQPHFFLTGADAVHHPELRTVLDILQEEATFSILSGPEQTAFESEERTRNEENTVEIKCSGEVRYMERVLGNVLNDRLADLLILKNEQKEGWTNESGRIGKDYLH